MLKDTPISVIVSIAIAALLLALGIWFFVQAKDSGEKLKTGTDKQIENVYNVDLSGNGGGAGGTP